MGVDAARAAMLAGVGRVSDVRVSLSDARGRTLAEPVAASRDQPPFAASAMDGYALSRAGLDAAAQGAVVVVGETRAGQPYAGALGPGEAVRISTGAALPEGADLILIQEEVDREGDRLRWRGSQTPDYVRPRGVDFPAGRPLLAPDARLDAIALALAAAAGRSDLVVAARPRVAVLTGGDEIVAPGGAPGPYQIFDSVTAGLGALIADWGGEVVRRPPLPDTVDALTDAARTAQADADLLVFVGGASVGDHDLVKPALQPLGLRLAVDTVAMRPGKPTWFGRTDAGPVLGLPGNPASALVCAHLFLRPLLAALQGGDAAAAVALSHARLAEPLPPNGPREHYLRSRLRTDADGVVHVTPFERQDSSLLSVFAAANALLRRPAHDPARSPGEIMTILHLGRN